MFAMKQARVPGTAVFLSAFTPIPENAMCRGEVLILVFWYGKPLREEMSGRYSRLGAATAGGATRFRLSFTVRYVERERVTCLG